MGISASAIGKSIKEAPLVYGAAIAALGLLGASFNVTLPADEKIAELEIQMAQNWQQRQEWEQRQQQYNHDKEVQDIQWRMRYVSNEINRLNMIPQYLNRPLTPQEAFQIEQLQQEWALLQERLFQLTQ